MRGGRLAGDDQVEVLDDGGLVEQRGGSGVEHVEVGKPQSIGDGDLVRGQRRLQADELHAGNRGQSVELAQREGTIVLADAQHPLAIRRRCETR